MIDAPAVGFGGLVDLAAARLGGRALGASDEFFAEAGNLLKSGRGVFIDGKFTERGKWMDGWESRRRRQPGHDWCILELGLAGWILGLDVDTNHFVGNAPSFAAVEGLRAPRGTPLADLLERPWTTLLPPSVLRPGAQNLFAALAADPVSHLRLRIFPDGGVARLRAFGRVEPAWQDAALDDQSRAHVPAGAVDLAAMTHGAFALACSDALFGPMNNLLMPGRAADMSAGWETRRRRGPGHDWIIVRLAARGTPVCVEIDTNHFIGNYPDRGSIDSIDAGGAEIPDLVASRAWSVLLPETCLRPHARQFFGAPLDRASPATHVRLNVFPDGGVSRLRVWGHRT